MDERLTYESIAKAVCKAAVDVSCRIDLEEISHHKLVLTDSGHSRTILFSTHGIVGLFLREAGVGWPRIDGSFFAVAKKLMWSESYVNVWKAWVKDGRSEILFGVLWSAHQMFASALDAKNLVAVRITGMTCGSVYVLAWTESSIDDRCPGITMGCPSGCQASAAPIQRYDAAVIAAEVTKFYEELKNVF